MTKQTLDKWYVLEAPSDLGTGTSAAGISDAYDNMQSGGMWEGDEDETKQQNDEMVRSKSLPLACVECSRAGVVYSVGGYV